MAHAFPLRDIPQNTVIIVAGPTASGKSAWALEKALGEQVPQVLRKGKGTPTSTFLPYSSQNTGNPSVYRPSSRIINGDSLQVYRGLDLLTAMPSVEDQNLVPHDLYGFLSPYEKNYNVSQWVSAVHASIQGAQAEEQRVWIVGGTGFYLKTLMEGLSPMPELPTKERDFLRQEYSPCSVQDLKKMLQPLDPIYGEKLVDKQRLLHAWIVHRLTGKALSWWHAQPRVPSSLNFFRVLIWPSREDLLEKCAQRWESMVKQGVYEEVRAFCRDPRWRDSPLSSAIGLRPIQAMLEGSSNERDCHQQYMIHIAQYIKRQRTWFRGQFLPDYVYDWESVMV